MKIKKITPEIMVDDMQKTLDFYTGVLGFEVQLSFPEDKPFFAIVGISDDYQIMFYHRQQFSDEIPSFKSKELGGGIALYIEVEAIQELYKEIKDKVKIIQELHETDYETTEFSFEDCNGCVLMLNEKK